VQYKLFLPGLIKLKGVLDSGMIGRVLAVRIELGYSVFKSAGSQCPSWNYRKEEGGGIVLDMFCHFRYLLNQLIGDVISVNCTTVTHIPERMDEHGEP
jgi:predicted dehydrogenase